MNDKDIILRIDDLVEQIKKIETMTDDEMNDIAIKLKKVAYDACFEVEERLYGPFYEIYAFSIHISVQNFYVLFCQ